MANKKPVYAGVDANKKFLYAKEFGDSDVSDSKKITYDTIGNDYLIHDNISDNLDVIETTFDNWTSAKTLTSFEVFLDAPVVMYPCGINIFIPFDTVRRDTDSGWNSTTKKYVVQKNGYYLIESAIKFDISTATAQYLAYFTTKIFIDDVLRVEGFKDSSNKYQSTYINDHSQPIRDVFSLEYLTVGQTVHIEAERIEIYNPTYSQTGLCSQEPDLQTVNRAYSYIHADIVNFLSINMVYSG